LSHNAAEGIAGIQTVGELCDRAGTFPEEIHDQLRAYFDAPRFGEA